MANIIKGDPVVVRRGKDRGRRGTVKAVFPRAEQATVEGLNVVKRHTKAQTKQGSMSSSQTGGVLEKEAPLPISALMYVCAKCNAPTRLRHRKGPNGSQRVCARCGEPARESVKGT